MTGGETYTTKGQFLVGGVPVSRFEDPATLAEAIAHELDVRALEDLIDALEAERFRRREDTDE